MPGLRLASPAPCAFVFSGRPLAEVFRLQGAAELEEAENRYLPKNAHGAPPSGAA